MSKKKCNICGEVFDNEGYTFIGVEYCWNCYSTDLEEAGQDTNDNLEQS